MKSVLLLCLAIPSLVFGEDQDTTSIELDEIVIAENRIQLPYAAQSRSITILNREQFQQIPVTSVADILRYAGGVDVRTRGVHGIQSDIGIRGGTFDQTLILVNGIKISDPQTGHHSLNLPVDWRNVERLEVLKGPGARTFGQNAFAGAVNVVTAKPKKSFLRAGLQGGDFELFGGSIAGAYVKGEHSHYAAINYDRSEGYKHNTDYSILNAFYNAKVGLGNGHLELIGGYTDRAFGANGFYASPDYTEQYEAVQTALAGLSYRIPVGKASLEARAYYRQNDDDYIFIRDNPEVYRNNHVNKTIGLDINTVIPFENSTTGIGIDFNKVSLESNNLGSRERFVTTLFIEHRMDLLNKKLNITPGVQFNNYSDFGFNALPGVDLGYTISERLSVFGNVGYTYRVPTFTDLYYTDPVNAGNPNLNPEYAWNYELGLKTRGTDLLTFQASLFLRDGRNMIDWTRSVDTDPWQPVNVLELKMAGFDLSSNVDLHSLWSSSNALVGSIDLSYTYIKADAEMPSTGLSRYALENLRHQLRIGLNLNYGSHISQVISFGYYDRVNLDDYTMLDTRLQYSSGRFGLFIDVTNIFDVAYQETNLVVMPGRWFKVGVDFNIL